MIDVIVVLAYPMVGAAVWAVNVRRGKIRPHVAPIELLALATLWPFYGFQVAAGWTADKVEHIAMRLAPRPTGGRDADG